MELVYKKDGFITKLFACLFIVMFFVMCVVGNFVFGVSINNPFSITDFKGDVWTFTNCSDLNQDNVDKYDSYIVLDYSNTNRPLFSLYFFNSDDVYYNTDDEFLYYKDSITYSSFSFWGDYDINTHSISCSNFNIDSNASGGSGKFTSIPYDKILICTSDLKDYNGNVVFQKAPHLSLLAGIVEQQEMKPLEEILTLLPIVMIVVVSFLALRKALAVLFNFLRTS